MSATITPIRAELDFAPFMEGVARRLLGDPNQHLSARDCLRWGSNGSLAVNPAEGTWYDHENEKGGGVLDLLSRHGMEGVAAFDWLRAEGFDVPARPDRPAAQRKQVAAYDYADEHGEILFQVVRFEPKDFRQRRPEGQGWSWSVKGVRQVPYRLPEIIEAIALEKTVYVVEGEKDADRLWSFGYPATCNAGGAGKWSPDLSAHFAGADVVILPDNDPAGRNHRDTVGASLVGVAKRVRTLDLPALPPKGDVSDWLDAVPGCEDSLPALVSSLGAEWKPSPPISLFGAIHWADLDGQTIRQDWLVEDMLFVGDAGLVFGASGSGKSFLTVDLGLSIARGVPFLGKRTRRGGVLYQAGEGGRGLIKRMRAYRQENSVAGDVPFVLLPARADFFNADGHSDQFIQECKTLGACLSQPLALVVIDTLSTASPGANENASEDMSRLLKFSERLQRETGAAVLWVHHKNAAGDRERGHTSLRANVDTALEVIRDSETKERKLRVVKVKDGEDGEEIGFELQSVVIGAYDDGKPMTSCVVRPAQVGEGRTGKGPHLSSGEFKFLKTLEDAITHDGGIMPPADHVPFNTWGVEWSQFTKLYRAISPPDQADDAVRKALSRNGETLYNKGVIGRQDRWIWISDRGRECLKGARRP